MSASVIWNSFLEREKRKAASLIFFFSAGSAMLRTRRTASHTLQHALNSPAHCARRRSPRTLRSSRHDSLDHRLCQASTRKKKKKEIKRPRKKEATQAGQHSRKKKMKHEPALVCQRNFLASQQARTKKRRRKESVSSTVISLQETRKAQARELSEVTHL
jgi:hypothetical protein